MATIYLNKGVWFINFTDPSGKRIRKSLKTNNKKAAEKFLEEIVRDLEESKSMEIFKKYDLVKNMYKPWYIKRWSRFNAREKLSVLFSYFNGRCYYCGRDVRIPTKREYFKSLDRAVIEHRIPVIAGGSDSFDNIFLACSECNQQKLDQDPQEFAKTIQSRKLQLKLNSLK